jgi:hypothetical protein
MGKKALGLDETVRPVRAETVRLVGHDVADHQVRLDETDPLPGLDEADRQVRLLEVDDPRPALLARIGPRAVIDRALPAETEEEGLEMRRLQIAGPIEAISGTVIGTPRVAPREIAPHVVRPNEGCAIPEATRARWIVLRGLLRERFPMQPKNGVGWPVAVRASSRPRTAGTKGRLMRTRVDLPLWTSGSGRTEGPRSGTIKSPVRAEHALFPNASFLGRARCRETSRLKFATLQRWQPRITEKSL